MRTFKLGTFVVALVAALALASTAMAKGGASCAQILDFGVAQGYVDGQPVVTTSYSVNNGCVDHEKMSALALDVRNNTTGFVGRSVTMLPYGVTSYSSGPSPTTPGLNYTLTLTVYAPNGKVADTRTQTVTFPAALTPAA